MELARARGPEALAGIAQVPDIEVRNLRALERHDANDLAREHRPRAPGAPRDDEAVDERPLGARLAEPPIETPVHFERRAQLRLVDHVRSWHGLTSLTNIERA